MELEDWGDAFLYLAVFAIAVLLVCLIIVDMPCILCGETVKEPPVRPSLSEIPEAVETVIKAHRTWYPVIFFITQPINEEK